MIRSRLEVLFTGAALALAACTTHTVAPPLARVPETLAAEDLDGHPVPILAADDHGEIVLFVRGLTDGATRTQARATSRALVGLCQPPYHVLVLTEPGMASLWPGFNTRGEQELRDGRARRAACLASAGTSIDPEKDAEQQVAVALDDDGDIRRKILGTADPGSDIVVAAFAADGRPIYRAAVPAADNGLSAARVAANAVSAVQVSSRNPSDDPVPPVPASAPATDPH